MSRPTDHGYARYVRGLTHDLEEARDAMSRGYVNQATGAVDRALAQEPPAGENGPRTVVMTALALGVVPGAGVGTVGGGR